LIEADKSQSNFDDFKLSEEDFDAINAWGKKNRVRSNAPWEYNPQYVVFLSAVANPLTCIDRWPINVFGEDIEAPAPMKVW
jgi:hypothetical protein